MLKHSFLKNDILFAKVNHSWAWSKFLYLKSLTACIGIVIVTCWDNEVIGIQRICGETGRSDVTLMRINIYRPQRTFGKVMFSQMSVILSTRGVCLADTSLGRHTAPWVGTPLGRHTPRQTPSWVDPPDDHCSGRYASYWNAFLLSVIWH